MDSVSRKIAIQRDKTVNLMLIIFAVFGSPVVLVSLVRATVDGMNPSLWAQVITICCVIFAALFRKKLPHPFKIFFIVFTPWLLGVFGVLSYGMGDASVMLLITAVIASATLGGFKSGIVVTIGGGVAIGVSGLLILNNVVSPVANIGEYILRPSSWLLFGSAFMALSFVTIYLIEKINEIAYSNMYLLEVERNKLEEANHTKDKLFQLIAHDLRSPFQGLISGLELFADQDSEIFDEAQRKKLFQSMLRDSNATFSMLENLLYWSRTQTGDLDVDLKFVDLQSLINSTVKNCQRQAELKSIDLGIEVPLGAFAYGDERSLKIILTNLLSNAIKFTDQDGKVLIQVDNQSDDSIKIIVKDSGIGVKKDDVKKLFDSNQYYSTRGTNNESGTGLGLGISFELAQLNDGTLEYVNNDWGGSSFILSLPVKHL